MMSTREDIKEAVWQAMEDGFDKEEILEAVQEAFDQGNPYEETEPVVREKKPPRVSTPELGRMKANDEPLNSLYVPKNEISDRWYPR